MNKKQNKKEGKKVVSNKNNYNTSNTNNTDNTSNTSNTTKKAVLPVLSVLPTLERYLELVFKDNISDKILYFLCKNKEWFTYDKIAEMIGKKPSNVRQAVGRHKSWFLIQTDNTGKTVIQVIQQKVDEIIGKLEDLQYKEKQKKEQEKKKKLENLKKQKFSIKIEKFIQNKKVKREGSFLIIDYNDILEHSSELLDFFLDKPQDFIDTINERFPQETKVRIINLPHNMKENIENLRKDHLNKFISLEARVTSLGEVKPVISKLTFECPNCGSLISKEQNYRTGILVEPKGCSCGRKGGFKKHSRKEINSCFVQLEDLQDNTDNPHSQRVKAVLFNGLCNPKIIKNFTPGNEVRVTGILKEIPVFKGGKKTVFINWIFEINNVELIQKDVNVEEFDEETIKQINELSAKIDSEGFKVLEKSFAPEVYGYGEIKKAIMLQLANKRNNLKNKSIRNKSNILLIGDPGIAKTVLCKYAVKCSSGAREAVGGGSSAVGITASVVKEEDSMGGFRVEPGAMILAKDLLFLDELNNLNEEDKPKLQEGMSEQRVSINKANLHVQMKVTCGILAVANPIHGHFRTDVKESLAEQFNIPTPILNRFDTVFMMRDEVNDDNDKKIAETMMKRHIGELKPEYSPEFLKKYFAYVRHSEDPTINRDVTDLMREIYSYARKSYGNVTINPRFFESLTRMSCASAKLRLSKEVEKKDLKLALKILSKSQYSIDELILEKLTKNDTK